MKSVIASLVAALAAVPLLAGSAAAGVPLSDRQLDTVTAGALSNEIVIDNVFGSANSVPSQNPNGEQELLVITPFLVVFVHSP